MEENNVNQFEFKGEIVEILNNGLSVKVCVMYKPGTITIEIPTEKDYELGDEVLISGKIISEKIKNIDYFSTN